MSKGFELGRYGGSMNELLDRLEAFLESYGDSMPYPRELAEFIDNERENLRGN